MVGRPHSPDATGFGVPPAMAGRTPKPSQKYHVKNMKTVLGWETGTMTEAG